MREVLEELGIDIEISDKVEQPEEDKNDSLMKVLGAIDWKLWEILQIMQKWDEEDENKDSDE